MKIMKKLLPVLLCVMMVVAIFAVASYAANGVSNVTLAVEKTEVNVGDTFTVTLSYKDMTVKTFSAGITFDPNLVECVSIEGARAGRTGGFLVDEYGDWVKASSMSSVDQAAAASKVGIGLASTDDLKYLGSTLFTVTFRAKAAGTATFTSYESTDGTDAFTGQNIETKTVTIKAATPACTHETTKLVPNTNGTHNEVCTNEECKYVVKENVTCTGTDDGNCTTAVECACGNVATPASNGHVAGADDGDCTTAVKCANCEQIAVAGSNGHVAGEDDGDCTTAVKCVNCDKNAVEAKAAHVAGADDGDCTTAVKCANCDKNAVEAKAAHVAGEDDGDCTTAVKCVNCDKNAVEAKAAHVAGADDGDCTTPIKCVNCDKNAVEGAKEHAFNSKASNQQNTPADCENAATYFVQCDNCDAVSKQHFVKVGEAKGHGSVNGFGYVTNNNGTHNVVCKDCSKATEENVPCADKSGDEKCDLCGYNMHVCAHSEYKDITATTHQSYCSCGKAIGEAEAHSYNHTTRDFECECGAKYTGWSTSYPEDDVYICYVKDGKVLYGWNEVEGAWYYFNTTSGNRATGLERVPYPTVEINGVKYAPNADDKAYWEAHKDTSKYSDATTAMFVFDENGKFVQTTGIVNNNRYAVNGMIGWHVGLVEIEGEYYYFKGDVDGGGNILATGNVYVTRNTTKLEVKLGGIYTFAADGKLCKYNGVTKIGEVLYYYDNYRLATDAGLIKNGEGYSYVRTSGDKAGQLVVNRSYWVSKGNGLLAGGKYEFGADGLIVMDNKLDGIVEVGGVYCYYKAGVKQVGAGVVEMKDEQGATFYIYVKSDGSLATGKYWPTTRNGLLESGEYDWGTDGKYYPGK